MPFAPRIRPLRSIGYADLRNAAARSRGFGDVHNNLVRTLSAGDVPCLADTDYGPLQPGQSYCSSGLVPAASIPCFPDDFAGPLQPGQLYCSGGTVRQPSAALTGGGGFCLAAAFPYLGSLDPYGGCQPAQVSTPVLVVGGLLAALVAVKLFGGRR